MHGQPQEFPDDLLVTMQELTGQSLQQCVGYLRSANGDINRAYELFLAEAEEVAIPDDITNDDAAPDRHRNNGNGGGDDIGLVTPQHVSSLLGHAAHSSVQAGQPSHSVDMFVPIPAYAFRGTLAEACMRADRDNRWVVVNLLDNRLESMWLTNDLWLNESVASTLNGGYFTFWQGGPGGAADAIYTNYRLMDRGISLPHIFIVHPTTRENMLDIKVSTLRIDDSYRSDYLLQRLWDFVDSKHLPHSYVDAAEPANETVDADATTDQDDDAELAAALAASEQVEQPSKSSVEPEVDLEALGAGPSQDAIRLRVKLPSGPWDLTLPRTLTVMQFVSGIRNRLRTTGVEVKGPLSLMVGFPPRKIWEESSSLTDSSATALSELPGLKNGDVVIPHY